MPSTDRTASSNFWQIPFSTRVDSITNHQHTSAEEDDLIVDDLVVDPDALTDNDLLKIQSIENNNHCFTTDNPLINRM